MYYFHRQKLTVVNTGGSSAPSRSDYSKKDAQAMELEDFNKDIELTFKMMDLLWNPGAGATVSEILAAKAFFAPKPNLLRLPRPAMARICNYLDPISLTHFKETNEDIFNAVFNAMPPKSEQKYYWNLVRTKIPPNSTILPKILKSWTTIVGKNNFAYKVGTGIDELIDKYNWKVIYFLYFTYDFILKTFPIRSIFPHKQMSQWKEEAKAFFGDHANIKNPYKFHTTAGCAFLRYQDPPTPNTEIGLGRIWFMENWTRVQRIEPVHSGIQEKTLRVELWELLETVDVQGIQCQSIPSIEYVLIILCLWQVTICPTNIGAPVTIELDRVIHHHFYRNHRETPPYVFNDKGFFGLWLSTTHFRLYKLTLDPKTRDAKLTVLQNILVDPKMNEYWLSAYDNPMEYMSILKNPIGNELPGFVLVSPTSPNVILKYETDGPWVMIDGNGGVPGINGSISFQTPSFCAGTLPLKYLEDGIEGRTKGHRRVIFWSSRAAHFLIRPSDLWISVQWPKCMLRTGKDEEPGRICSVEIIDINNLLVGTTLGDIWLLLIKIMYPAPLVDMDILCAGPEEGTHYEGLIEFEILRRFDMKAYLPKAPLEIRLDFWDGQPYLFTVLDYPDFELRNLDPFSYEPLVIDFNELYGSDVSEKLESWFLDKIPNPSQKEEPIDMTKLSRAEQKKLENVQLHKEYMFM